MLEFPTDNIYVKFSGQIFQLIAGIPKSTNGAPLIADFFFTGKRQSLYWSS